MNVCIIKKAITLILRNDLCIALQIIRAFLYIYIGMIFFFENNKNNVKIINCCFYASSADKVRSTF